MTVLLCVGLYLLGILATTWLMVGFALLLRLWASPDGWRREWLEIKAEFPYSR